MTTRLSGSASVETIAERPHPTAHKAKQRTVFFMISPDAPVAKKFSFVNVESRAGTEIAVPLLRPVILFNRGQRAHGNKTAAQAESAARHDAAAAASHPAFAALAPRAH